MAAVGHGVSHDSRFGRQSENGATCAIFKTELTENTEAGSEKWRKVESFLSAEALKMLGAGRLTRRRIGWTSMLPP
jgi:hypothetical protein